MKFAVILVSVFFAFSNLLWAFPKCSYSTEVKNYNKWGGSPWAYGTSSNEYRVPKGPCENYGGINEIQCLRIARDEGFDCYQMTDGSYDNPQGSIWSNSGYDYQLCFACYDNGEGISQGDGFPDVLDTSNY